MPSAEELLGVSVSYEEIDAIHQELAGLVRQICGAGDAEFGPLYASILSHTEAHFAHEERLIEQSGFPHAAEHVTEHRQILQEMRQFQRRIVPGRLPLVRAYVKQRLPERLNLHITRMDSLLASFLNNAPS